MLKTAAFSSSVAAVLFLTLQTSAAAAAIDPYVTSTTGYDYSYPQCPGTTAPAASFGIVGVNAGYPFTYYNNCLAAEYSAAPNNHVSLYMNTGYDPSYTAVDGRHTTAGCQQSETSVAGTPAQQAAWAVGCSEASRDLSYATSQSATAPSAWWLDVETGNSWSSSDLSLNRYTIQGIVDTLRSGTSVPVGIYSTSSQWNIITGGYQAAVDANWLATGQSSLRRAQRYCSSTGFTGAKVWLVQYVATYDHDYAC